MPTLPEIQLNPPDSWNEFEELCFQLFKREWNDFKIRRNGKQGQGQNGVDIYGNCDNKFTGLQCKGKQVYPQIELKRKEILDEVKLAIKFKPPLNDYIILTTAPRNAKIQEFIRLESLKNTKKRLFSIDVFFWEDIKERLITYIDLVKQFYPFLVSQDTELIKGISEKTLQIDDKTNIILEKIENIPFSFQKNTYLEITDLKDDIDYAKQLLETHKPETAFDYLIKVKENKWPILSSLAKFRILTNLGSSKFQMNLFKEASEYFIEAYDFNKNDEKALSNLALAYSIKKERAEVISTINKVLEINKFNINAHCLYIHDEELNVEDIIRKLPSEIINKSEILYSIALKFFNSGKYIKAIEYFKSALENDEENNPNIRADYASCKLEIINSPEIVKNEINVEESLVEIINLLDSALETFWETEEIKYKYQWILNRGLAKKLKGNITDAIDDVKLCLKYNENDRIAKRDLSLLYFEQDKEKGIEYLKGLVDDLDIPEDRLLLSDFYRLSGRFEDSEKHLKVLIEQNIDNKLKSNAYRILEIIYEEQGLDDKANEINGFRLRLDPKDILARVDSAIKSKKRNNISLSNIKLIEAIGYIDNDTRYYERQVLSNALYNNKLYNEAIKVYEHFVNKKEDSTNSRKLLNCYYITKKWDKALDMCKAIRMINEKDIYLLNIETYIYEQLGDNKTAKELFESYLKKYDEPEAKLNLSLLYLRMGNKDDLDSLLNTEIEYSKFTLEQRIQLAQTYSLIDKRDIFFDILYNTLKMFYNNSEAHSAYVWLILQRGDKDLDLLKIDTVENNTVVYLENKGESEYYILEDNESADLSKKEINSKNQIYNKLINKKINEEVILIENEYSKEIWTIKEIKSKYIYALHESMKIFNRQFPENKSLQKIVIQNNDIKDTLKILTKDSEKGAKTAKEIVDIYKNGKITIGMVSKYFNKNIIELWSSFVQDSSIGILNNFGNKDEISKTNEIFSLDRKIVIDQITLNTLVNIKIDSGILGKTKKYYVSQSLLDEINEYKSEVESFNGLKSFKVYKNGDNYLREDKNEEIIKSQKKYLDTLLNIIQKYCQIIPLDAKIISEVGEYDKMKKLIGVSSINSVFLAKQLNALLYSDDLMLRNFAKTEFNVDGIWTQYYLQKLMFDNVLQTEEYCNYVISLSDMNYKHTSINAEILIHCLKNTSWKVDSSVNKLFSILNGNNSDFIPAVMVAVDFTFLLWNQLISNILRDNVFILILNNLVKYRDTHKVISLFASALQNKFYLIPISYNELIKIINDWSKNSMI